MLLDTLLIASFCCVLSPFAVLVWWLARRDRSVDRYLMVYQEDGKPSCRIDMATYYDNLPENRRF